MTWLMIMMLGAGASATVKYIEFPTQATCEAAVKRIDDRSSGGFRPVCVEGGKPVPETPGASPAPEKR
jgi:hypothetical protein